MGSGGVRLWGFARPQGQARDAKHSSYPRGRVARATATSARAGAEIALRVHLRTWSAIHNRRLRPHGRARRRRGEAWFQGAPAHAQACLWLRAGEQGARYARPASVPRTPEHPAHGALHRVVADAVQGFLAELTIVEPHHSCRPAFRNPSTR
jgi:hypothetical protein